MMWRFFSKGRQHEEQSDTEDLREINEELEAAEAKLEESQAKLEETRAKSPELARAVASARRVHYKVDKFTKEIERSFGRLNHG